MEATLKFELPLEKDEFDAASRGMEWALIVWEIDQLLRNKLKHGELFPNTRETLEKIRDTLNDMLVDKGLTYPE